MIGVTKWDANLYLVSYGVEFSIRTNDRKILGFVGDYLPPNSQLSSGYCSELLYSFISTKAGYQLYRREEEIVQSSELEDILESFDSDIRLQIGTMVENRLFVHAGVVEYLGKAIVIPGRSFTGKTTLVAALVKKGATYYSDEYAVIDTDGWVHSYPRPLSIRQENGQRTKRCPVEVLGGTAGDKPIPIGLIVETKFKSGAKWQPEEISKGQGMLALLDNTLVARIRPEFALPILKKVVSDAVILKSERPEADITAKKLIDYCPSLFS